MKKLIKFFFKILDTLLIIIAIIIILKFLFPTYYEKYMRELSSLVINFIYTSKKDFEKLKNYGVELNFPKNQWFYYFNYDKAHIKIDIINSLPIELNCSNKICKVKKVISIFVYKNQNDLKKIINYFKNKCSYKQLEVKGKEYYIYFCKEDLIKNKTCKIYSSITIIPFNSKAKVVIMYSPFILNDTLDFKKLKNELGFIKLN